MANENQGEKKPRSGRADRQQVTAEESLKRVGEFPKRMEAFIAAIRKGKDQTDTK